MNRDDHYFLSKKLLISFKLNKNHKLTIQLEVELLKIKYSFLSSNNPQYRARVYLNIFVQVKALMNNHLQDLVSY